MVHKHGVRDTGAHFTIDQFTRQIKNASANKTTIVQFDHNSERLTFEMPLYIDGHAMTLCDLIELHYINISTDGDSQNHGTYEVNDISADGDKAIFTWLISQEATQLAGSLNFFIVFKCTENGVTVYRWGTEICKSLAVSAGMDNGEAILTEYSDILAQWKAQLFDASNTAVTNVATAEASALAAIESAGEAKKQAVLDSIPDEYEALSALADRNHRNKAGAIVLDAEGESIVLNDASEYPLQNLKVFGKSTQDGTPTPDAPVDIVSVEQPVVTVDEQTLALSNILCGIPVSSGGNYTDENGQQWICDEVDLARGVYVQRVNVVSFDGTENWQLGDYNGTKYLLCALEKPGISNSSPYGVCTHATLATWGAVSSLKGNDFLVNPHAFFSVKQGDVTYTNADDWKVYIAEQSANGMPVEVYYAIATPIETALSDAEINAFKALHSNKPNTTILNDAGAYMAVEYVADTKTYIDNKIAELTQ